MEEEVYTSIFTFDEHATPASLFYMFRMLIFNGADITKSTRIEKVYDENKVFQRYEINVKYKNHNKNHLLPTKVLEWLLVWGYACEDNGKIVIDKRKIETEIFRKNKQRKIEH